MNADTYIRIFHQIGDRVNYIMTSACLVLDNRNHVLLKKDPKRGWELPGGCVELGETFEETAIREVKEETGIDIEVESFCGISQEISKGLCHIWSVGKVVGGSLTTSTESLEVGFFEISEALALMTNEVLPDRINLLLRSNETPFYVIFQIERVIGWISYLLGTPKENILLIYQTLYILKIPL